MPAALPAERPTAADGSVVPDLGSMNLTELAVHFHTDKWGRHRYTGHYERPPRATCRQADVHRCWRSGSAATRGEGRGGEVAADVEALLPAGARSSGSTSRTSPSSTHIASTTYRGQPDRRGAASARSWTTAGQCRGSSSTTAAIGPEHIRETFRILFPLLRKGGWYIIEDTQTSYWPRVRRQP